MSDYNIKAEITADSSGYTAGVQSAVKQSKKLSTTLATVGLALNGLTASFRLISGAIKTVTKAVGKCTESFKVQLKAEKALDNAIKNSPLLNGESADRLKQFASQIQKTSNYGDEQIIPLITQLTALGRSEAEAMQIVTTAVDMASTGTVSLDTAISQLNMTMNGNIGRLGVQNAELINLTKEELANGKAVEILSQKYKGMAQATIDPAKQLNNLLGDIKETIGSKLNPIILFFQQEAIKTFTKLQELIQNLNIARFIAVFKVAYDEIKVRSQAIINAVKNIAVEIKSNLSKADFKPLISLFNTILGLINAINREIKGSLLKVLNGIVNLFSSLGKNIDLEKVVSTINTIIDAFVFLYDEVKKVFEELGNRVKEFALKVWGNIKAIFESSNEALRNSETDIKSWKDYVYSQLNQYFRFFQDVINSTSALLRGDWAVAWEYFKLSIFRALKIATTQISTFVNAFPKLFQGVIDFINEMIDKANEVKRFFKIPGEEMKHLADFKPINLSEKLGIDTAIEDAEKKIQELTGEMADKGIRDITSFSDTTTGIIENFVSNFQTAVEQAEGEITALGNQFSFSSPEGSDNVIDTYKELSEWDKKLLEQRQDNLKEWQKEYNRINLEIIEIERKNALEEQTNEAERLKINQYYDKLVLKEKERFEKARQDLFKNTTKKIVEGFKTVISATVNLYQSVAGAISNIFGKFKSIVAFNISDSLDSLLQFEDSVLTFFVETLPRLPDYVTSVFESVRVLFTNIQQSIDSNAIEQAITSIFANNPMDLINTGVKIALGLVDGIVKGIKNNKGVLIQGLEEILNSIVEVVDWAIENLPSFIEETLPDIIDKIAGLIVKLLSRVGPLLSAIMRVLPTIIDSLLNAVIDITADGIPNLLNGLIDALPDLLTGLGRVVSAILVKLPDVVTGLVEGLCDIIANMDSDDIGKIIDAIVEMVGAVAEGIINSVEKIVTELIPALLKLCIEIIKKLPDIIGQAIRGVGNVINDIWDSIVGLFTGGSGGSTLGTTAGGIGSSASGSSLVSVSGTKAGTGTIGGITGLLRYASGTNNALRGLSLVGEAGPELVRFNGGEQVLNNRNTNKALSEVGSKSSVFNVTFNNTQDTTAFAMMSQLKQYQKTLAFNGVL